MAVCTVEFYAASLRKQCAMNLIIPESPNAKKPFGLLIQLHGLSDDHTAWLRRTSIDRYVSSAELPLVVAMPDGGRGFYCDAVDGAAYESHIMRDVLGFVERFLPVRRRREARAIGGLSMGGYGALKLGLHYPHMFSSVAAHSSPFDYAHEMGFAPGVFSEAERRRILGDKVSGGREDVFALAAKIKRSEAPAIRFDCGSSDSLLDSNRRFHRHLAKLGIKHEYREYPGGHNWAYWDEHIQEALKFHMKNLRF